MVDQFGHEVRLGRVFFDLRAVFGVVRAGRSFVCNRVPSRCRMRSLWPFNLLRLYAKRNLPKCERGDDCQQGNTKVLQGHLCFHGQLQKRKFVGRAKNTATRPNLPESNSMGPSAKRQGQAPGSSLFALGSLPLALCTLLFDTSLV